MTRQNGFKTGTKIYNAIPSRRTTATLARLRTGHCVLKRYLHRFNIEDSPYCKCNQGMETVEHYLLECSKYKRERDRLRKEVKAGGMRVDKLLGNPKNVAHTMEYVVSTKGTNI